MSQNKLYQHIERLWSYMQMNQSLEKSDCIFVLGSNDVRVAEYAAELFLKGWANKLIFSGGYGRLTDGIFSDTEADTFTAIAQDMGVPAESIIVENKATNTGENVLFTYELLKQLDCDCRTFILVQKPYMERRTYATFTKQWPASYERVCVTSPNYEFCDYFNEEIDLETTVVAMLGDYERIKTYPALGFQTEQSIPQAVEDSYLTLKKIFA